MDKQEPVAPHWARQRISSIVIKAQVGGVSAVAAGEAADTILDLLSNTFTRATRPADDGLESEILLRAIVSQNTTAGLCDSFRAVKQAYALGRSTALRAQSDAEVEREAVVRFIREQGDVADTYALAADKGTTRRAAYGGAGFGCVKLADAIERGEHRKDGV